MLPSIASLAVQIGNRQEQPDAVHQTCGARRMESGEFRMEATKVWIPLESVGHAQTATGRPVWRT